MAAMKNQKLYKKEEIAGNAKKHLELDQRIETKNEELIKTYNLVNFWNINEIMNLRISI